MTKLLVACFLALTSTFCQAAPPIFHPTMRGGLECIDRLDPGYYIAAFREWFGISGAIENGAVHFKVTETLYGSPIEEIYVSIPAELHVRPIFIAAVFSTSRSSLQEQLKTYPGLKFFDGAKYGYSFNYTQSGVRIYELDGKAIMMCIIQ